MSFATPFPVRSAEPIVLRGVSHGYSDRVLFESVDLVIRPGEHVVIVGENGAGKSTLLRLMAGKETPDAGWLSSPERCGYLDQEPTFLAAANSPVADNSGVDSSASDNSALRRGSPVAGGRTVREVIDAALAELRWLEAQFLELSTQLAAAPPGDGTPADTERAARYDQLITAFALRDGYRAEARVAAALDRLGLGGVDWSRPVDSLSGGEAERLALACLFADPEPVLLLDEPTNHLDPAGLDWLEERLAAHRGTVVVVSHDRMLLHRVAHTVIEVDADQAVVSRFGNGYRGYLTQKQAARSRWEQAYQQWQDAVAREREKTKAGTGRNGYGRIRDNDKMASGLKAGTVDEAVRAQIRNARERLRRLEQNPVPKPPQPLRLAAQLGAPQQAGPVLEGRNLSVPGRLDVAHFTLHSTQKVLLSGPNGAGKSTLLEVLAGRLAASGELRRRTAPESFPAAGPILGYLPQEIPPFRSDLRLLPAFAAGRSGDIEAQAEELLGLGLFRSADLLLPVRVLSAGQRRRFALARLLLGGFEVLLVDEPTNHLAPQLVEELQDLFGGFNGALLLVSHDRMLQEWFAGLANAEQLRMDNGRLLDQRQPQSPRSALRLGANE